MHRPQRPQSVLTAAIFETETGLELRVDVGGDIVIHAKLSRDSDGPLLIRAKDVRQVLIGKGGSNSALRAPRSNANSRGSGRRVLLVTGSMGSPAVLGGAKNVRHELLITRFPVSVKTIRTRRSGPRTAGSRCC